MSAHSAIPDRVSGITLLPQLRAAGTIDSGAAKSASDRHLAILGAVIVLSILGAGAYCVVHFLI